MLVDPENARHERTPFLPSTAKAAESAPEPAVPHTMPAIVKTRSPALRRSAIVKQFEKVQAHIPASMSLAPVAQALPVRRLFQTPVTILVGPSDQPFVVHLQLLLTVSPFFVAHYNPEHRFPPSNTLRLPSVHAAEFEYFVQWLYTRSLEHELLCTARPAFYKLIRLYSLADYLGVTALKNDILDEVAAVADRANACPTPMDTRLIWDDEMGCGDVSTHDCSRRNSMGSDATAVERDIGTVITGLRELAADLFVWKKSDRLLATHPDAWDERFLRTVCVKLMTERRTRDTKPWRSPPDACSRYHLHDKWAPACVFEPNHI